jgi:hypothetical protein
VLDPKTLKLDRHATEEERETIRKTRLKMGKLASELYG